MKYAQATLITIGAVLFSAALLAHKKALEVAQWRATDGYLLYAYTQNLSSPTVASANDWGTQKAIVQYRYSVNRESFTGDTLMLLDFIYFPQNKIHTSDNKAKKIIVYFNPQNPSESLIHKDYPYTSIIMVITAGTLFLLIGISLRKLTTLILNSLYNLR